MWRYFTKHKTRRYMDALPHLVHGYNRTYHRNIRRASAQVNAKNALEVSKILYCNQVNTKHPLLSKCVIAYGSAKQNKPSKNGIYPIGL
jgi:hypothetical protein